MSIYISHWPQQALVQHLSADGHPITVGALVELKIDKDLCFLVDLERHVKAMMKGYRYRVLRVDAVDSSRRESMGIERERKANAEIKAGKERWYAAVTLAAVLTNGDGSLARIQKSPCESFVEKYLRCMVPAEILRVIQPGNGKAPVPDVDYSITPYEHLYPKYQALDHSYNGWSNCPTACLGDFLITTREHRQTLKGYVTKGGEITARRLEQLARAQNAAWILEAVPQDAYFTDSFPVFAPYRQEINFAEIAAELTCLHKEGSL